MQLVELRLRWAIRKYFILNKNDLLILATVVVVHAVAPGLGAARGVAEVDLVEAPEAGHDLAATRGQGHILGVQSLGQGHDPIQGQNLGQGRDPLRRKILMILRTNLEITLKKIKSPFGINNLSLS